MSTLKHFHDQANGPQSFPLALQYHGDGQVSRLVMEEKGNHKKMVKFRTWSKTSGCRQLRFGFNLDTQ